MFSIAAARAAGSPTGTSGPTRPPSRTSLEPEGQSVLTQGHPQANASMRTPHRPSYFEDTTNTAARRMHAKGLSTHPGRETISVNPFLRTMRSRRCRQDPSPRMRSRSGRFRTAISKAWISVGKSLTRDSRPAARMIGGPGAENHGWSGGSAAFTGRLSETTGL